MKGDDAKRIAAKTEELGVETGKLFEAARAASTSAGSAQTASAGDDDVVDAEFEDVSGDSKYK